MKSGSRGPAILASLSTIIPIERPLGLLMRHPPEAGIQAEGLPQAVLDHIDGLSNQDHTSESSHPLKQEEALKERRQGRQ